MNKSDFWRVVWVPVRRRKPPEDRTRTVLIWNYELGMPFAMDAATARYSALASERGDPVSTDRKFSHWCFVGKPEGK